MFFPMFVVMFSHYVAGVHVSLGGMVEFAMFVAPVVMTFKTMAKEA